MAVIRALVALVLVSAALYGVVGGYEASFGEAVRDGPNHEATDVINESQSVNQGELVQLDECCNTSRYYYESDQVTVYNTTANETLVKPAGNYTWIVENGTLSVDPDSEELNATSANITYGWYEPSDQQTLARDLSLFAAERGEVIGLALGGAALLGGAAILSNNR